jgi:hypothetical protein
MSRPTRADAGLRAYLDLQNLARRQGRPTQALPMMYVLERFLARLAAGPHAEQFVLKGGRLLAAWQARRATVDADLRVRGLTVDPEKMLATVSAVAAVQAPILDAANLAPALAATARHRGVSLRALTAAIGTRTGPAYPTARAATYTAYRRRLGPGADRLPVDFTTVVADVVAFADPLLEGTLPAGARWRPELRAWQT